MENVYKSKIGLEIVIPLAALLGAVLVATLSGNPSWSGVVIVLCFVVFVVHMFMTTDYSITGNDLTVRCSFLFNKTIDINTIKRISETNNPLSSPAISLDRLEIRYGVSDSVMISPQRKKEVINALRTINPNIEVKYKKGEV
jgi:hypothetical protein